MIARFGENEHEGMMKDVRIGRFAQLKRLPDRHVQQKHICINLAE